MTDNLPVSIEADEPFVETRRQDPIYHTLRDLGVQLIRVSYSGSCDCGCLNEIEALDKNGQPISLPDSEVPFAITHTTYDFKTGTYTTTHTETKSLPLTDALEQWCYDLLEEFYPGWEINEGSSGEITIDPQCRAGSVQHTYYIEQFDQRSFT